MSVIISDEILQVSQLTPSEFRQEIALHLFQKGEMSLDLGESEAIARLPDT